MLWSLSFSHSLKEASESNGYICNYGLPYLWITLTNIHITWPWRVYYKNWGFSIPMYQALNKSSQIILPRLPNQCGRAILVISTKFIRAIRVLPENFGQYAYCPIETGNTRIAQKFRAIRVLPDYEDCL